MSEKILAKAKQYLVDGKVLVMSAGTSDASFAVQGSASRPYMVNLRHTFWDCDCPAQVEVCAHVQAAKLIYKPLDTSNVLYASNKEFDSLLKRLPNFRDDESEEVFE